MRTYILIRRNNTINTLRCTRYEDVTKTQRRSKGW